MKHTLIALSLVILCGCSTSTIVRTNKAGDTLTFHNTRVLWKSGHAEGKVTATGMSFSLDNSNSDSEAIANIVGAAVSAAVKAPIVP